MGLIKRTTHTVLGVELPQAYAKVNRLYVEDGNKARAYFAISNNRNNLNINKCLEEIPFECEIDKNKNVYEQVYIKAKENIFQDWEDDIIEISEQEE